MILFVYSDIVNGDEKVVVVSVVGHSSLADGGDKTATLRLLLGCNFSKFSSFTPLQIDDALVSQRDDQAPGPSCTLTLLVLLFCGSHIS